jgi:hypothetical protein
MLPAGTTLSVLVHSSLAFARHVAVDLNVLLAVLPTLEQDFQTRAASTKAASHTRYTLCKPDSGMRVVCSLTGQAQLQARSASQSPRLPESSQSVNLAVATRGTSFDIARTPT